VGGAVGAAIGSLTANPIVPIVTGIAGAEVGNKVGSWITGERSDQGGKK
jgi:hypothetical protein